MGTEYFFVCIDCNEIYEMDGWNNALRFLPCLQGYHRHHNYVSDSEHAFETNYENIPDVKITADCKKIETPYSCKTVHVLKNPKRIDCFDEEFLGKFKEWEDEQERKLAKAFGITSKEWAAEKQKQQKRGRK